MQKLSAKEKENALNEIRILASVQSQYIVAYKDAFYNESSGELCIVMEYADKGDLQGLITRFLLYYILKFFYFIYLKII